MPTKKELQQQAEDAGLTIPASATKAEFEEALAGLSGDSAGVEGRSIDTETETPSAEQSDKGTMEKDYIIAGETVPEGDDLDRYERNFRQQAQQVGLRTTGDVKLKSSDKIDHGRGRFSTRLHFEAPVVKAASDLGDTEPTVSEVVENEEAELEPLKPVVA